MPYLDPQNPRTWYSASMRWRRRAKRQLDAAPCCAYCLKRGIVTPAEIADHITPHRGNWNEFHTGKLQSLCRSCHSSLKAVEEKRGHQPADIDQDGMPLDPAHPFNRAR